MIVYNFQGPYRFLSNFYIEPNGSFVEREYQAAKCQNPCDEARFDGLTPGQCKRLGRKVHIKDNWDHVRIEVMYKLVYQKFLDHDELETKLLSTGDAILIEGNYWGDRFWGKINDGLGTGENHLGKILMKVRNRLR